jgi:acetoin utilization deacetylase AcuC-like enzyme
VLPFPLIYHEGYDLHFGDHVFPTRKYRVVRRLLLAEGFAGPEDFLEPQPATHEQLLLVHTPDWVRKLETGTLTYQDILRLEVPYSRKMVMGFLLAAGGTLLAAREALRRGLGFNVGGGFHHAFPGHGEGFCAVHDVAVAIRALQSEGKARKVAVVDCDVHHGNGTAAIFAGDAGVFTLSLHHFNNYPSEKPPSTLDVHLADGVGDAEYLEKLDKALDAAIQAFRPELVFYVAGADPYCDDQLGGLSLTMDGMRERDRLVIARAFRARAAVVVTLAGGYARNLADTVQLHANTAKVALEVCRERRPAASGRGEPGKSLSSNEVGGDL